MTRSLHIRLLGEFGLVYGGTPVTSLDSSRTQALLAYLVLHRDAPQSRRHLAFLFWPDTGEGQALTNLRNLLHKLRQALPEPERFLQSDAQTVQWRPDAPCTLDVADLASLAQSATRADLEQAASLYRGDLLPSCYDDWILPERTRLQQIAIGAFERLIGLLEEEHDMSSVRAAIGYAERLHQLEPLNEATYRTLMRLHAANCDRAGTLCVYHTCMTTLQREFAAESSPETRELYQRLLSTAAAPVPPIEAAQDQPPLVGRQREWKVLQDAWQTASHGKPQCAMLTGEAGIGKTRLAEELLTWASRQGCVVAAARCYAAEGALAYAPVIAWLRAPAVRQRLVSLETVWLSEVARLLPELLTEHPDLPQPAPVTEGAQRQRLFDALARAMLNTQTPLMLLMDDMQWCDRDTLEWLHYLLRFDPGAHLMLIGTVRVEETTGDRPLATLESALRREGQLTELALSPLDASETASLAARMVEHALTSEQATRLFHETEGNPLFVVEAVRFGLPSADTKTDSRRTQVSSNANLPPKVHAVLQSRLAQLSPNARELVGLAAAIGREFTFPVLARASDQDEDALVRSLDELWQRRIVRDAAGQGTEAYDFTHDKLREVAYNGQSAARRRWLHHRIAQALEVVHASALDSVSGQIAAHYELAGRVEQAIPYYERAARAAQRVYANADAIRDYRHAIALLATIRPAQELAATLHEGLGDVLHLVSQHGEARAAYRQAMANLVPTDLFGQARLQCKIGKTLVSERDMASADRIYVEAQAALGPEPPLSAVEWWQVWLEIQHERILLHYWIHESDEIEALVARARPFVEQYGTPAQRAQFYHGLLLMELVRQHWRVTDEILGYARAYVAAQQQVDNPNDLAFAVFVDGLCWFLHGDLDQATEQLRAALAMTERIGDLSLQSRCLAYLTIVHRQWEQVEATQQSAARSLQVATAAHMPEYMAMATANLAWAAWRAGDLAPAKALGHAALELWSQLPLGLTSAPFLWLALWPLIAVALHDDKLSAAMDYARTLLDPALYRLPEALTASLEHAIGAWDGGAPQSARALLQQSVTLAQQLRYL
jgi:DNA-binding SARP family transcriptional activator/tetratricopeptide (TPR) repeat protein